jgi:O-antigen/teichoic acid export membrane protein
VPVVALYLAIGQPSLLRRAAFIRALLVLLLIYPAVKYVGLLGAALTPAVALAVSFGFQVARVRSLTGLDVRKYLAIVPRAVLFSLPVVVAWVGVRSLAKDGQPLTATVIGAALAGAIYAAVALLAIRHRPLREFIWPRLSLETAQ